MKKNNFISWFIFIAKGGHMVADRQIFEKIKRDIMYGSDITSPHVNRDKCKGCGSCVRVCPALVFELREGKSNVMYGERCIACGHCWAVCPEEAVIQEDATTATGIKTGPEPAVSPDTLQLLIRERRSTRLFNDKPVSKEQLFKIIEAGRYSPTASNRQDVNYIVLSNRQQVSELRLLVESFMEKTFKLMQNKVVALFYGMKFGRSAVDFLHYYAMGYDILKNSENKSVYFPLPFGSAVILAHAQSFDQLAPFNCSAALYSCSLMAHSLGLGSCFTGFVQIGANADKKIKHWLDIPKENEAYGAMVVGHPDIQYRRLVERKKPDIKWR
jgi:nitroreductase/NAD-dependent dihydropyrimidine dehydrogenase PreA subunit